MSSDMSTNLADRIARLAPAQRALLEKRLSEAQTNKPAPDLAPRDPAAPIPLSSPQARLWLIQQLDPELILFNAPGGWHLRGVLNERALQMALDTIVARHAALRTGMSLVNGEPMQTIHPPSPVELPIHDLHHIPSTEQMARVHEISRAMARRPFDLAQDVLLRAAVVRLGEDESIFLTVRHHIANDAWSVAIFNHELAECYRAFAAGETPQLPVLASDYADFAYRQKERMQGAWYEQELGFWRSQLLDVPNLELPTDHPRPPRLAYHGVQLTVPLDAELGAALHALSRREGVTLFMLTLAAFELLLARYAGQTDFAVGTNILGRDRVEYENLIGYFANVLALRADLTGTPTFREFLERTRRVVLDAFSHREVPFEKIIWDLHRTRDEARTPLFQVMFQTTQTDFRLQGLPGLDASPLFVDPHTSEYDISLEVRDYAEGIQCAFRYSTDLFEAATIERMAKQYEVLLRAIVANPDAPIAGLPLLSAAERAQLVVEWNQTQAEFPRERGIHKLVQAQAREMPDAIAAVFGKQSLTYRELNAQANQLAHALHKRGVRPDTRVGICLERSLDMLVAILGVLKAGGAYLPLEPNTPTARLGFILEQAAAVLLLTSTSIADKLPSLGLPTLLLDEAANSLAQESETDPNVEVSPSNLAYVIYTSGTTGQPKGVMIEHHSLANHATFFARYYALAPADRVLQFAPIAFDFAAEEIFPAWLAGAAVVVRPEREALAPREFLQFVAQNGLTVLDLPTAFWHTLVDAMTEFELTLPPSVRLVIVGGEQVSPQALARWQARVDKRVRWVNTYGPTEATIAVTTFEQTEDNASTMDSPQSSSSIGRPIANAQIFILDAHSEPVPVGVVGDLYIGGEPVARGYLNQPALTAEKFIPNPFGESFSHSSSLLYRTGDLARYHADGQIEFRGRRDDQIKLRGFRIELGEIEGALAQHPSVKQTAVVLREDAAGDKRLAAYVVASDKNLTASELRIWLQARVPEYMVPATLIFLDALPLTAHGKLDRRALPATETMRRDRAADFVAPRTRTEELVAGIWKDVLHVPQVSAHANFFELGGHSLLATVAVARAEATFAKTIPLRSLFENPSLEAWARVLDSVILSSAPTAPPIVRLDREQYRRAVPAQH